MASYATGADLIQFYDWVRVGELARDDRLAPASTAEVIADPNLLFALQAASGEVDAACRVGGRYTSTELATIATADAGGGYTNTGMFLKRLVCDITFEFLVVRRGLSVREVTQLAPRSQIVRGQLEQLRQGERILDDSGGAHADAGVVVDVVPGLDSHRLVGLLSNDARFFGCGASRLKFPGGYGNNGCC